MKRMNVRMKRGMAFLFVIVMLVTQLGIGNLNVYAEDNVDGDIEESDILSEMISNMELAPVNADGASLFFNGETVHDDSYVYDYLIHSGNPADDNIVDNYAYYKDGVLTLHNFQLDDCVLNVGFEFMNTTKVVLDGENIFSYDTAGSLGSYGPAFSVNNPKATLTITGDGSLKIYNNVMGILFDSNYDSDFSGPSLVIDGVSLDIHSLFAGIIAYKDVVIKNSDVSVYFSKPNMTGGIQGAINVLDGTLSIEHSTYSVDAYVEEDNIAHISGIYADTLSINDSEVDIKNLDSGIKVSSGDFSCLSSDINITAFSNGILGMGKNAFSDSNVVIVNAYGEKEYQKADIALGCYDSHTDKFKIDFADTTFTEKGFSKGIENRGSFSMSSGELNLLHSYYGLENVDAEKCYITGGTLNISAIGVGIELYGNKETDAVISAGEIHIAGEPGNTGSGIDMSNSVDTITNVGLMINGDANVRIDGFRHGIVADNDYNENYPALAIEGGKLDIDVDENAIECEKGFRMISGDVTLQSKIAAIRKLSNTVIELGDSVRMAAGSTFDSMEVINPDNYADEKCVHLYKNFVVTFDNNGHGKVLEPMNVVYGAYVSLPKLESDGIYDFGGWYKEKECINPWNADVDTVKEDITLYAKWDIRYHDIKIEKIGNGTVTTDKTKAYMGEKVAIKVVFANGFELDTLAVTDVSGKKNIEIKNNVFEMPDEDVVIKATFKEIPGDEEPGADIPKDVPESFGKYILTKQKMNVSDMFADTKEKYKDEPKVKFKYVITGTDKAETKAMKKAASVTGKGLLKAKKAGFVNVTLQKRAKGEKKWTTVSSNMIRIAVPSFATNDGKNKKFIATYEGQLVDANSLLLLTDSKATVSGNACVDSLKENAEKITWSTKSKAISIDADGKITVNKSGSAVVKAVIEKEGCGKNTVLLKISVKIPKYSKTEYKVEAGKSVKLSLKNTVKGVNEVVSMTSDNKDFTVDITTKKVTASSTAKSGDKAVITAVTTDGKKYSCNVLVK